MNNQEVPQGYKKTKLGVIPLEWEVVKVGEIGDLIGGGTPSTSNKDYWQGSIPWISSSDLTDKSIYTVNKHRFITDDAINKSATKKIPKNSILIISRVGVGKVAINDEELCVSQDFQCLIPKESNIIFLTYLIKEKTKILLVYNQGTSIKGFVKSDLKNLKIPIPPLKEQQKIATILTTWDDAISKQEELIKAKEQLKKGLMQKLLSGEIRFDGFSGEWEEKQLKNIFIINAGKSKSKYIINNGNYYIIDMGSISKTGKLLAKKQTDYSNDFLDYGDLVMPKDDIGGGQIIGKVAFIDKNDKYIFGDHIFRLQVKNDSSLFLSFLINSFSINKDLKRKVTGSAQLGLNKKSVETIKLKLPSLQEQQKIAQVLSTADKEIELLKNELESLKEQKKGLMQKLLTGKVRVMV